MCELLLKCKLKKRKPVFIVLETKICVTSKQKAKGGGGVKKITLKEPDNWIRQILFKTRFKIRLEETTKNAL